MNTNMSSSNNDADFVRPHHDEEKFTLEESVGSEHPGHLPAEQDPKQEEFLRLLEECRQTSGRSDEQNEAWGQLIDHCVARNRRHEQTERVQTGTSMEGIIRLVLLEWPYNSVYSNKIDSLLDACGIAATLSACSRLLKELASQPSKSTIETSKATSSARQASDQKRTLPPQYGNLSSSPLPRPSILQACWKTIQRILLTKDEDAGKRESATNDDYNKTTGSSRRLGRVEQHTIGFLCYRGYMELEGFVKLILLLPPLISNACHNCRVRLPLLATPPKFFPQLIDCAWNYEETARKDSLVELSDNLDRLKKEGYANDNDMTEDPEIFRMVLLKTLLRNRHGHHAALGLANHHPLSPSQHWTVAVSASSTSLGSPYSWSARELNSLLSSLLYHGVAMVDGSNDDSNAENSHSDHQNSSTTTINKKGLTKKNVLTTCQMLLREASLEHQEAFVQHMVLVASASSSSTASTLLPKQESHDLRLCAWMVELLQGCGILHSSLVDLAQSWSQWTFCQEVSSDHQHFVSQMIIEGLNTLSQEVDKSLGTVAETIKGEDPLILILLQGVTHRLDSFVPQIRLDGMRIAHKIAKHLGQEVHFEELDQWDRKQSQLPVEVDEGSKEVTSNLDATAGSKIDGETAKGKKKKTTTKKEKRQHSTLILDPDADYDSDDSSDSEKEECEEDGNDSDDTEDDTIYDDELVPYDLEDDEEDLAETRKPLHLLEALGLLRTSENEDHAYSNHLTALKFLPELIRKHPDDLADAAVSLLLQVLRMENKFGIPTFMDLRQDSMVALAVEEPMIVGSQLIEEIFKESSLTDRFACFAVLQEAAYELSGSKAIDQNRLRQESIRAPASTSEGMDGLPMQSNNQFSAVSVQLDRLQAKTRRKRSRRIDPTILKNQFSPFAPIWFYQLLGLFVQEKDNEVLWTGSSGSQLLASLFRTLAAFVEFGGIVISPVLAKDLLELIWSFRDAEVADVRMAVLVALAPPLQCSLKIGFFVYYRKQMGEICPRSSRASLEKILIQIVAKLRRIFLKR